MAAAAPESRAAAADLDALAQVVDEPRGEDRRAAAFSTTASRRPLRSPSRTRRYRPRRWPARRRPGAPPGSRGVDPERRAGRAPTRGTRPSSTSTTRLGPDGDSSSRPPSPWTTSARRAPRPASVSAIRPGERRGVDAEHPVARTRRVREGAEDVEHGARPELLPHRRGVPHRGMVDAREHEPEAVLVDRARRSAAGGCSSAMPSCLEHVCRATRRARGAVPVLRDGRSGAGRDERRRRRDVERPGAVAPRADDVDERRPRWASRGATCAVIASAKPAISSAVSPFARRPTSSPPICAGVASPLMTTPITSRASSRVRSRPSATSAIASAITRGSSVPSSGRAA